MKIAYKFSYAFLIVLFLVLTCLKSFSHGILHNDVELDTKVKTSEEKQIRHASLEDSVEDEKQTTKIDEATIEKDSSSVGFDEIDILNSKLTKEESYALIKDDENSPSKSKESPVLKIVKLVADLKETASENIGKLLNAKANEQNNKKEDVEIESTTVKISTLLEPKDSGNILLENEPNKESPENNKDSRISSATSETPQSDVSNSQAESFQESQTLHTPEIKSVPLKQEENNQFLNLSETNLSTVGVIVGKPDMQSFEEWKEMKLKESPDSSTASSTHSESEVQPKDDFVVTQPKVNEQNQNQQSNLKKPIKKERKPHDSSLVPRHKNYAGLDCGAKIIENNPESSNPSHVLTENKDDYMLNSCKNNVWFIIELCEPIKLIEFSLANFELFSNVPRQFRIYASERYIQSSNWNGKHLIGTFEASNTRNIQTFNVNEPINPTIIIPPLTDASLDGSNSETVAPIEVTPNQIATSYIKYIKFEMISHYGTEHFCPLSLVRIYGKTKNDEEGVEESAEDTTFDNSMDLNEDQTKLNKTNSEDNLKKETQSKEKNPLFEMTSIFLNNIISILVEKSLNSFDYLFNGQMIREEQAQASYENFIIENIEKPSRSTMKNGENSSNNESSKSMQKSPEEKKIVKRRKQMIQMDLHNIFCNVSDKCCVSLPREKSGLLKNNGRTFFESNPPQVISSNREGTCFNWFSDYCGYYFLVTANSIGRRNSSLFYGLMNNLKNSSLNKPFVSVETLEETGALFTLFDLNNLNYFVSNDWLDKKIFNINFEKLSEFNPGLRSHIIKNEKRPISNSDIKKTKIIDQTHIHLNDGKIIQTDAQINDSKNKELQSNLETAHIPTKPSTTTRPSVMNAESQLAEPQVAVGKESVETDLIRNKENSNSNEESHIQRDILESASLSIETIQTELNSLLSKTLDLSLQTIGSTTNTPPSPTTTTTQTATPHMPNIGKTQQTTKEDNLTSLNNRIKILEFNMSLSSQYLEKLSQHYRKQLDEMQKAFNLTLTALIDTIRVADERDIKQNDRIILVEKKLDKMRNTVDSLSSFLNELKFQTDVIMWTIIVVINIAIFIEIYNCVSFYSSKKNSTKNTKTELNNQNQTYHLTISQINNLIDTRLKNLLDQQNDLYRQLEQSKSILESRIENISQFEKKDISISSISSNSYTPFQKTIVRTHNSITDSNVNNNNNNTSNLITPCSLYNDFESEIQKNKAASVLSSTLSVVAAVSLAAVSLDQLDNSEKT